MSFGMIHRFAGGNQEQDDNMLKVVHPDGGKGLPEGQTLHVAGPTADGWLIFADHDTHASWERFRDGPLASGSSQVANGLPGPPDETTFEIHKLQTS